MKWAIARVKMFDDRKAFDLIDLRILVTKLSELDIPLSVVNGMSVCIASFAARQTRWGLFLGMGVSNMSQESLKEQN